MGDCKIANWNQVPSEKAAMAAVCHGLSTTIEESSESSLLLSSSDRRLPAVSMDLEAISAIESVPPLAVVKASLARSTRASGDGDAGNADNADVDVDVDVNVDVDIEFVWWFFL